MTREGARAPGRSPLPRSGSGALRRALSSRSLSVLLLVGSPQDSGPLAFDRFHGTPEIEAACASLARQHPRFFRCASLGKSVRGRSIPILEVTDHESPGEK